MEKILVAITGGIGSGKSTVSNVLRKNGYKVYDCDEVASKVLKDEKVLEKLSEKLDGCYKKDGKYYYDRAVVSKEVFKSREKLAFLNGITHPIIMKKITDDMKKDGGITFAEVPLLFESGFETYFDYVIIVTANIQTRIERVKKRSNLTEQEIKNRIKNQYDYEKIPDIAHTVIYNDCEIELLNTVVKEVVENIKKVFS